MELSKNFFVVSNYNVDPAGLLAYASDYIVYDQSDDSRIVEINTSKKDPRIIKYPNTGHNHIVFFKYIVDNYENLPERIAFLKGNIIGRHVTQEYWIDNYRNEFYTFLWCDPLFRDKPGIAYSLGAGQFLEKNNSWFTTKSSHRFFVDTNTLISFFYDCTSFPEYNLFAPGGCYIVERERILRNPKSFYLGLIEIMNYSFFPSEVWMVERLMHFFFTTNLPLKQFVYDENRVIKSIHALPDNSAWVGKNSRKDRLLVRFTRS